MSFKMTPDKIKLLVQNLEEKFRSHTNIENGIAMSRYMKGHFPFYGIKSPERVLLTKEWMKDVPADLSTEERWELVTALWKKDQREFQYVAMDYLHGWKRNLIALEDIKKIEFLITHRSWWDTVDSVASNYLGKYFLKFPEQIEPTVTAWRKSNNLWLKRSCMLFQLKYREKTDLELLKNLIRQFQPEKEFFIQKAIGWTLRQYSKTDPVPVRKFVDEIQLKGLAAKEATKYL